MAVDEALGDGLGWESYLADGLVWRSVANWSYR